MINTYLNKISNYTSILAISLMTFDLLSKQHKNDLLLTTFILVYIFNIKYLKIKLSITWLILFSFSLSTVIALGTNHHFFAEKLSIWLYIFLTLYFIHGVIDKRNIK